MNLKKLLFYSGLLASVFLSVFCNQRRKPLVYSNECAIVDTIVFNYEHGLSNEYMTNHLSDLSEKTGITDRARRGTIGCTYSHDSIFYADMKRFRLMLKCPSDPPLIQ